jgi:hypothetical protein
MKRNRGDKPVGVIIHIYMEKSQGNSLCSYFYLKQAKLSFFSFFFYKIREQEGGARSAWQGRGEFSTRGRWRWWGKRT